MMSYALLLVGLIAVVIAAFLLIKKSKNKKKSDEKIDDKAGNFSQARMDVSKKIHELAELAKQTSNEIRKIVNSSGIRPESNQQRNLDRETGGVEEGKRGLKNDEQQEIHDKDAWDERSEQVDKMGSFNPLAGDDKESMIWQLKKKKLDEKKGGKKHSHENKAGESHVKRLKQERAHDDGRGRS